MAAHFVVDQLSWLAVKNGSVPDLKPLAAGGIPRDAVVGKLRAVLTPQNTNTFYLIHGDKGVGKSTLVVQAAHAAVGGGGKNHGGIIYVEAPEDAKEFGRAAMGSALAAAFRHNFMVFDLWQSLFANIGDSSKTGTWSPDLVVGAVLVGWC